MNRKEKLKRERKKDEEFFRAIQIRRVEKICDFIKEGLSYQEMCNRLASLPKFRPDKRGNESVDNVKKAIKSISFISKVRETPQKSYEDRKLKYDLVAILSDQNLDFIGIQVKSSDEAISKLNRKIRIKFDNDLQNGLNQMKLITLNGQLSPEEIQKDFLNKFSVINSFHYNNLIKTQSI